MDRSISSGPEAERSSGTAARFRIQAMDCAAEESEIRRALEPVAGIVSLSFQLGARTLAISAPQPVIAEALAAIRRAGFDPQPLAPSAQDGDRTADPHDIEGMLGGLRRPVIALLLAAGAEGLAYFGGAGLAVTGIEMALAAAAIWLAGFETYRKGFSALCHGRLNITALMSVAVTGAFLIGQWPEAAMVMALYAIAELIEARSLDRARNAIQSLLALAPQQAQLRQADGTWQTVAAADVPVDAIVRIRPGERVPLDGVVTAGASAIDQARQHSIDPFALNILR
jgi:Cd2+/Zn2+-exporting ATPase